MCVCVCVYVCVCVCVCVFIYKDKEEKEEVIHVKSSYSCYRVYYFLISFFQTKITLFIYV